MTEKLKKLRSCPVVSQEIDIRQGKMEFGIQNSDFRIRNSEFGFQNSEYGFQNSEFGFQNSEYGFQNSEFGIQNSIKNCELLLTFNISTNGKPLPYSVILMYILINPYFTDYHSRLGWYP